MGDVGGIVVQVINNDSGCGSVVVVCYGVTAVWWCGDAVIWR